MKALLALALLSFAAEKKTLVVHTNTLDYGRVLIEGFQKAHPDIEVRRKALGPIDDYKASLLAEKPEDRADVVVRCQEPLLQAWIERRLLAKLPGGGVVAPVVGAPHVFVYNSKLVADAAAPRALADLLKPEWKGKAALRNPVMGNSGAFLAEYVGARDARLSWYRDMASQNVFVADTPRQLIAALDSGTRAVALMRDVEFLPVAKDHPHLKMILIQDPLPYQQQVVVINKRAADLETARLFVRWALADGQKALADAGYSAGDRKAEHLNRPHWLLDVKAAFRGHDKRLIEALQRLHSGGAVWPEPQSGETALR